VSAVAAGVHDPVLYGAAMNFAEFQASGRDVPDILINDSIRSGFGDDVGPIQGRLYFNDELYIEGSADAYCLTIGNSSHGGELVALERELYEFAVGEGYIDAEPLEDSRY
jgi:hypothetical protein